MTDDTEASTLTDEEAVLEQYVRNQLEIKRLTEENDMIKGYYKDLTSDANGRTYRKKVGKFYVQATRNARLDEAKAIARYPYETYPVLYKTVPDARKLKSYLDDYEYQVLQKEYAAKIEIGLI